MALHHKTKKTVVERIKAQIPDYGIMPEELRALIASDEAKLSEEEIEEVIAALELKTMTRSKKEELDPNRTQPFELWDIKVDYKKEQNPETFEVETVPVITKKGDKPVRITHMEQRHADILNSQAQNSKQYYYPKA